MPASCTAREGLTSSDASRPGGVPVPRHGVARGQAVADGRMGRGRATWTRTRDHNDLDVLIEVESLERFRQRLHDLNFAFKYVWDEETWWVHDAFVVAAGATADRLRLRARRRPRNRHTRSSTSGGWRNHGAWTSPYELTAEGLTGRGVIGARRVRCLTADMQRSAHTGYELAAPRCRHAASHRGDASVTHGLRDEPRGARWLFRPTPAAQRG